MSKSFSDSLDEARNLNRALGRLQERDRLHKIIKKISCSNHIGEYVYVSDLMDYLNDPEEPGDE